MGFALLSYPIACLVAVLIPFLVAFLVGIITKHLATMKGKKPGPWVKWAQVVAFILVGTQFFYLAQHVFIFELWLLTDAGRNTNIVLLQDAKKVVFKISLNDVNFDVPLTYNNHQYYPPLRGWMAVPKGQYEGKGYDKSYLSITVTALLPDLEGMSELNYKVFERSSLGQLGSEVRAHLDKQPLNRDSFFKNEFARLKRLPDDFKVPGMLHFVGLIGKEGKDNIFLSHDYPSSDLTEIHCREYSPKQANANCTVYTVFVYKNHRFGLIYSFAPEYLSQWYEIGQKVKALFEHFAEAAQQNS